MRPMTSVLRQLGRFSWSVMRATPIISGSIFVVAVAGIAKGEPGEKKSQTSKLNLSALLADPIPSKAEFKYLIERRRWLAGREGDPADFENLADEFAKRGAFFSATELLWFADKMTRDSAKQADYQKRMREWLKLAESANKLAEEGQQLCSSGRTEEGLDRFAAAIKMNPYCEKARYQWSNARFHLFLDAAASAKGPLPLDEREKLFRLIYEQLHCALAIDPILYDAHALLGSAREMIPDDREFLAQTQSLTDRAVKFRNEVIPPMDKIEQGERDPALFQSLGESLEGVGILDYAVFAYQTALKLGSREAKAIQHLHQLQEQISKSAAKQ